MTEKQGPKLVPIGPTIDGAPVPLPSKHIVHSEVVKMSLSSNLGAFRLAQVALETEIEGQEREFQAKWDEEEAEFNSRKAKASEKHLAAKASLLRQLDDYKRGIEGLESGIKRLDEIKLPGVRDLQAEGKEE